MASIKGFRLFPPLTKEEKQRVKERFNVGKAAKAAKRKHKVPKVSVPSLKGGRSPKASLLKIKRKGSR